MVFASRLGGWLAITALVSCCAALPQPHHDAHPKRWGNCITRPGYELQADREFACVYSPEGRPEELLFTQITGQRDWWLKEIRALGSRGDIIRLNAQNIDGATEVTVRNRHLKDIRDTTTWRKVFDEVYQSGPRRSAQCLFWLKQVHTAVGFGLTAYETSLNYEVPGVVITDFRLKDIQVNDDFSVIRITNFNTVKSRPIYSYDDPDAQIGLARFAQRTLLESLLPAQDSAIVNTNTGKTTTIPGICTSELLGSRARRVAAKSNAPESL